ncbi:3-oxoadipate enol-lactonase [Prosthecomicrobium sp. N25]|uniref:3-oxoadipate enol-lactonase n=1 Tax=Prosthecomicrobium sp. N25 TaxID=3129254 RepID=UPI00307730DA
MPFVSNGAVRLFHMSQGPAGAPPVLFSNSLGTTHRMWDSVVDQLAAEFRCIRYDTRGHGASDVPAAAYEIEDLADDAAAILDHLDIERAHVVGLSLGGMVGQAFALRYPSRTISLTLMATTAYFPTRENWYQRAALVRREGTQEILGATLERWFTEGFRTRAPAAVAAVADVFRSIDRNGYAAACEAIGRMDLRPLLGEITPPVTIIGGTEDPATPPSMARALHEAIARSRLVMLSPAAHLLAVEQAPRVCAELRESFARTGGSS